MSLILPARRFARLLLPGVLFSAAAAHAQLSLAAAVELSTQNSPRVRVAQADAARALAALQETRDVYIPTLTVGGSGYGKSFGVPLGQPIGLTIQSQALAFSFSQRDYVRAARAGLASASFALAEAREAVAEDAVLTCLALDHDSARIAALEAQQGFAGRLVMIIEDRLAAGQDTSTDLTAARLTLAQLRLRGMQAEDDQIVDRSHLAHLTGVPVEGLSFESSSLPAIPGATPSRTSLGSPPSPGIDALFANARAKREQAFGDHRYLFRPQVTFAGQYSLISTFAYSDIFQYYGRRDNFGNLLPYPSYAVGVGVQVSLPILDYVHRARARESAADAAHAEHDAEQQQDQFTEARLRNNRSVQELAVRAEIASLDQQLARQQLDILQTQLQSTVAGGTPMTPKDEQNARITERDKYLNYIDATFQLHQAQVSLLRQTGELDQWLSTVLGGSAPLAAAPDPSLALAPGGSSPSVPR